MASVYAHEVFVYQSGLKYIRPVSLDRPTCLIPLSTLECRRVVALCRGQYVLCTLC